MTRQRAGNTGGETMETPTLTAERLRALADLYEQGQVSDLMERTLEKLLRHEADVCQVQLRQLQADLREFEQKYQRSSAEFYRLCRKFCSGGHERTVVPVGGGLRGQSVELFGRREAFVSGPDYQLFLLDHVPEFDPDQRVVGCVQRFKAQHRPCHPLDGSMVLFHDIG